MRQTLVGVFDQRAAAQRAAEALAEQGIGRDHIHVTGSEGDDARENDEGMGSRIRSFFAEVFGSDEPDHQHASEYHEAMRRGAAFVKVDVDEETEATEARQTLQAAGAVDIDERVKEWRASGWQTQGSDGGVATTGAAPDTARLRGDKQVVPVVEEQLEVGKREVNTGGVRIYTRTVSNPVEETLDLKTERAEIQRRAVDRPATQADLADMQDRTVEVRETAERPVVSKTARVVEEVEIGKRTEHTQETVRDTVRHTEVEMEPLSADTGYRSHFQSEYGSSGARYEALEPAYRYGDTLRNDARYQGRQWNEFEPQVRQDWESRNPGTWEHMKAAVRHAWERVSH